MTASHSRRHSSRSRLTLTFLVVLLPPAVTLIWLGLRLLEQDRILQVQREIEGREAAAEGIARSLTQSIAELENRFTAGPLTEGVLRVVVSASGIRGEPAERLLWTEKMPELPEAAVAPFLDAEKVEFQGGAEAALRTYRELLQFGDETVRVGALLRVARVERNQARVAAALDAYVRLSEVRGIAINGTPADLLARRALCALLKESGRDEEFRRQVAALATDLLAQRWTLDRAHWELAAGEIARWTEHPLLPSTDHRALTTAAESIWRDYRSGILPASGRRSVGWENVPVTMLWRTESLNQVSQLEAMIITPAGIEAPLKDALQSASRKAGRVTLLMDSGDVFCGQAPDAGTGVARLHSVDTGLPWTVALSATDESRAAASLESRRRLLASGLAAIVLLLAAGSYFLWRVIAREMEMARLQADFVATVSHEFRTPLTSLRHITELLEEDDGAPGPEQEQRKTFYAALGRNTERLHRLVESLLDFSRMETGKKPWRREAMDAGVLAAKVAAEFGQEFAAHGVRIDLVVEQPDALLLKADAEALGHALWNLLDNAVKYSPGREAVRLGVGRSSHGVVISVRDEGLGIPANERRQIFGKFVRGQKASELGIKGTGLGLAIVSHIVAAHGGAVELESEEGKGSTFRMVLPA